MFYEKVVVAKTLVIYHGFSPFMSLVSKFGLLVTVRALAEYPSGTQIGFVELFEEFPQLLCYSCFFVFFRC